MQQAPSSVAQCLQRYSRIATRLPRVAVLVGLFAGVLLILGTMQLQRQQRKANDWVAHALEVLGAASTLDADLATAVSEGRGFLNVKTAESRVRFDAAALRVRGDVATLRTLTEDNAVQRRNLGRLAPLLANRIASLHEMVQEAGDGDGDPTGRVRSVRIERGRALTDQVHDVLEDVRTEERRLLRERTLAAQNAGNLMLGGLVTCAILVTGSGLLAVMLARRREREREYLTELRQSYDEQHRTRTFLDAVIEHIPAMLFIKDAHDHRILLLNQAGEELLGVPRRELLGKTDHDLFPKEQADHFVARDREVLYSDAMQTTEETIQTPAKGPRLLITRKLAIRGDDGEPRYLLGFSEDITERRAAEGRIVHMTYNDELTGLPNRLAFRERLEEALARARRYGSAVALLSLNLDRFKGVNDTFGYAAGDALLQAVGERLRNNAREVDTIARLGGDEFAVLQAAPGGMPETAAILARRLLEAIRESFEVDGRQLTVDASIGVAIGPENAESSDILLSNADLALDRAKSSGGGTFSFFEAGVDARLRTGRALEHDLHPALERGEFTLHYQPLLQISTRRVVGVEALLRWRHPERGLVSPAEFIPVAEEVGLLVPISHWVVATACTEIMAMSGSLRVAVNLSPTQFTRGKVLDTVKEALAASGLPASRLEVEITESVVLQDNAATSAELHGLRALGVRIVMDDFGTGYSSLSCLQRLPFGKIKIDQSFVREMVSNPGAATIIRAAVGLGTALGLVTVAEGVETEEQLALLQEIGCDEAQGYLFSRPLPGRELAEWLASQASSP